MKRYIIMLCVLLGLMACQKEEVSSSTTNDNTNNTVNTDGQTLLFSGDFVSGAHATSGKAKIYEDKDKKRILVLENFKTDAGPDLRLYLAEDKSVSNFIEVSNAVKNGSVSYSLPSSANLSKQKVVLIWCKQFSVLFGSAQLN
jgi:hypothetical protein